MNIPLNHLDRWIGIFFTFRDTEMMELVNVLVVILFPTEYKQWRTEYVTTMKP